MLQGYGHRLWHFAGHIAREKEYSCTGWFACGLFFNILGLMTATGLPGERGVAIYFFQTVGFRSNAPLVQSISVFIGFFGFYLGEFVRSCIRMEEN